MANHLADAKSPYLLQHAGNPVDWYPWSPEALELARTTDRPILVSIGYSACHWCHVMAHESFENATVAALMNDHFVNIKVDREEMPDVDAVYMEAVQMMTGQGGWPLNVFLTPDLNPFYGGTYFPPVPSSGMASWPQVLQSIAMAWKRDRPKVEEGAKNLVAQIVSSNDLRQSPDPLRESILNAAFDTLGSHFDSVNGGFGHAPKFPQPLSLQFLLRTWKRTQDQRALDMVTLTLERMGSGGIYDHLGGGFHRYSVDDHWLVPHFEKMLYDNALLSRVYLEAWQVTKNAHFRSISEQTLDYVLREMTGSEGGFYSAQDADSSEGEGSFYVWTPSEIREVLGEPAASLFIKRFGVTDAGNFEGKNILTISTDVEELARQTSQDVAAVEASLEASRQKLLAVRGQREPVGRDEKVLTDWNALMLRSFVLAGRACGRSDYIEAALRNAEFMKNNLWNGTSLLHAYKDGWAGIDGYLDDHAYCVEAFTTLYEATGEEEWLSFATGLARRMRDEFHDAERGGFYSVPSSNPQGLPLRTKSLFDNVAPSGNSSAAMGLLRLARLTGDASLVGPALTAIRLPLPALAQHASSFAYMLSALDFHLALHQEIVIVGPPDSPRTSALREVVDSRFLPNALQALRDPSSPPPSLPLLEGKDHIGGEPAAFVCEGYVCAAPVTDPAALAELLSP